MTYSVDDIARALGCEATGRTEIVIDGLREPADAGPGHLALALRPEYAEALRKGKARAALLWNGADWQSMGLDAAILAPRPRFALATLSAMMDAGAGYPAGIHPSAVVAPEADIGADVSIGAGTIVEAGARIGAGSIIGPQCYIGRDVWLGERAFLHAQVTIGHACRIGARFIAHSGVRVGADGFSFVTPEESAVEHVRQTLGHQGASTPQSWARIHSLAAVEIGEEVEIGANSCIDRGTVRDTVIGGRTKIDNLVQIGHNCQVGEDNLICGQAGLAGSVITGRHVVLGGQSAVADNLFLGDNVIAGGGSKIASNVPSGRTVFGYPATKMDTQVESYKALRRLPRLAKDIAALKKAVFKPGESD